jgi:hypothetical protein
MSLLDLLKKGFGYVLLSMGVSRPEPKSKPAPKQNSASGRKTGSNP